MRPAKADPTASVLRLGAFVSVIQSGLFVVIGISAMVLGVDELVDHGFASLPAEDPTAFRILCGAFVAIALLGLAITPAERALIGAVDAGLAGFGAALAYLGHAGTIAFFSWWLLKSVNGESATGLGTIAPIDWGVTFELVFVGAWVWVIAAAVRRGSGWPRGFLALSILKATSFWFAFAAFVVDAKWMIVLGVGAVAFVTGPSWHLWIALILKRDAETRVHAG